MLAWCLALMTWGLAGRAARRCGPQEADRLGAHGEQERALRRAAAAAVELTAGDLRPDGGERAEELAMVVSEVFRDPVPDPPMGHMTLLEGLQAGIAGPGSSG
jgi:hypothetical protein